MEIENTFTFASYNPTIRQANAEHIERDLECQQLINELRDIEEVLRGFGFLTFGRDFVFGTSVFFSLENVLTSLELTLGSVIVCCESACIADANTLLRKYRDDLFFYLYISAYNSLDKHSEKAKAMETNIAKWLKNDLVDFQISQVLKSIATAPQLRNAVLKFNLKESFQKINDTLNDYVHSNGYSYYNRSANSYRKDELVAELRKLVGNARYMTIVFLLLLIFCSPVSVMSGDHIDCLELNITPPKDSQYWVAPFVEHFVKKNISLIDTNCLDYLRENTMMQF